MSDDFLFDLEDPPVLIRDQEYARCPGDHPCRAFIKDNYRWHHEISRWRRTDSFPAGYWGDDAEEEADTGLLPGGVIPGVEFDVFEDTDAAEVGQLKEVRK